MYYLRNPTSSLWCWQHRIVGAEWHRAATPARNDEKDFRGFCNVTSTVARLLADGLCSWKSGRGEVVGIV
jgi:hypothetical protein